MESVDPDEHDDRFPSRPKRYTENDGDNDDAEQWKLSTKWYVTRILLQEFFV